MYSKGARVVRAGHLQDLQGRLERELAARLQRDGEKIAHGRLLLEPLHRVHVGLLQDGVTAVEPQAPEIRAGVHQLDRALVRRPSKAGIADEGQPITMPARRILA